MDLVEFFTDLDLDDHATYKMENPFSDVTKSF